MQALKSLYDYVIVDGRSKDYSIMKRAFTESTLITGSVLQMYIPVGHLRVCNTACQQPSGLYDNLLSRATSD